MCRSGQAKMGIVIDDESAIREIARRYLEHAGFNVLEAIRAEENRDDSRVPVLMLTAKVEETDHP